jgi:uncharacterized membrane protein YjgN (DUF898 family)
MASNSMRRGGACSDIDAAAPAAHRFRFTGTTAEYFRIWIVSLCLSLATLGIYSAWAKVRKKRYLYAHTLLDGTGLEYRASPLAILRGRVIALAMFGGFALAGHVLPAAQLVLIVVLLAAMPWIVVASSRFNARNTAWRNITFAFDGGLREATKVFIGLGLATLATLGLLFPYFRMRRARFIVEHHRFGATRFEAKLDNGGFFVTYLVAALMVIGAGVLAIGAMTISLALGMKGSPGEDAVLAVVLSVVAMYASYIAIYAFVRARIGNLTANGTSVGTLRCRSTLRIRDLVWLYLSNVVAVLATFGLATPWVIVRLSRYRAERLELVGEAPLDQFASAQAQAGTATGSEVSDLFDVDVSL